MSKPVITVDEPPAHTPEEIVFMVTSGFGHNTQRPFVQVLIEAADWMTQMSPANARELAYNLLSAADAAESDGFLVIFLRHKIGLPDPAISKVLTDFRDYRDAQRNP